MKKILTFTALFFAVATASFAMPSSGGGYAGVGYAETGVTADIVANKPAPMFQVCPMDMKICEDGTSVARSGPDCTFASCENNSKAPTSQSSIDMYACSGKYAPVCAEKFIGKPCNESVPCASSIRVSYENECLASLSNARVLYKGECLNNDQNTPSPDNSDNLDMQLQQKQQVKHTMTEYLTKNLSAKAPIVAEGVNTLLAQPKTVQTQTQAQFVISSIKKAATEDVRRLIFKTEIQDKIVATEDDAKKQTLDQASLLEIEKKKKIIIEKSKNVFSKFDFFTEKATSTANKITDVVGGLKTRGITSQEIDAKVLEMNKNLILAQDYKTEAWLELNTILLLQDMSDIKENLDDAKYFLNQSKNAIKETFKVSKEIIEELKNILK